MAEVASWPATVLPQLQHIGCSLNCDMSDLSPVDERLLPHLSQLLTHRPMHPFYVHLFNELADEDEDNRDLAVPKDGEEFHLPCVRLTVIDYIPRRGQATSTSRRRWKRVQLRSLSRRRSSSSSSKPSSGASVHRPPAWPQLAHRPRKQKVDEPTPDAPVIEMKPAADG
jgi:hypothetical protein